jgi:nitrous oxide reductase accessory protein NosL
MSNKKKLNRREAIRMMTVTGVTGLAGLYAVNASAKDIGALMPGKGWLKQGDKCNGDGTPLQFIPKTKPDPEPLKDELQKYPKCPYCGMDRKMWNHSRHLVHYDDDLADGTCSLLCAAISLSLNMDRGPKAIYAADFGSDSKIKPMVNVDKVTYLVGSDLPGTMTKQSKMAFSSPEAAKAAQKSHGGELATFDEALTKTYLNMAKDTAGIRKRRAAKRKK